MKKIISMFLGLVLCLSLTACGKDKEKTPAKKEFITDEQIAKLYTDPEKFAGKYVTLSGQLMAGPHEGTNGETIYQIWSNPDESSSNTVFTCKTSEMKGLELGDYVKITGQIEGKYKGKDVFGGTIDAPKISLEKIEKSSYKDVVSPTLKEVEVNTVQTSNGVTVTLQKVEFSPIETRLYVSVDNQSDNKYYFHDYSCKIVQDGNQLEVDRNPNANYPEISNEILAKAKSEGVIIFKPLKQTSFKLVCSGQSNDQRLLEDEFIFEVNVK